MWIPYRLYEALPKIWMAVGGVVLAGALYFAYEHGSVAFWVTIALGLIIYGAVLVWLRRRYRRPRVLSAAEVDATIVRMARRFH